jgi:hypothetical protein
LKDIKGPASLNSIWQPNVQIYNVRDVEIRFPEQVIITEDRLVQYTQRYYATLSSPLDFREFPFDEQIPLLYTIAWLAPGFCGVELPSDWDYLETYLLTFHSGRPGQNSTKPPCR